ncbi:hypothetical protein [uncultured Mediterranean phage uvMED]|nr:hypothetical protein [uncultured Mediterranean phage uvMED]
MKTLNVKSTGNIEMALNSDHFLVEQTHEAFSVEQQNSLNELVASIQSEGLQELHIEQADFNSFVHKVKSGEVLVSDNVNSYQVFEDLENYITAFKSFEVKSFEEGE